MYTKRRKLAVLLVAALMLNVVQPVLAYEEEPGVGTEETTIQNEEVEEEKESESEGIGGNVDMDSASGARSVDTTAPTVDLSTLTVSTKEAVAGDKVVISFKVEDESGVDAVSIDMRRPVSGEQEFMRECVYNSETGYYEYTKIIDNNTQSGTWTITAIYVWDKYGNYDSIEGSRSDFSAADFIVKGTEGDWEAPVIDLNTLAVSTKEAVEGDKVVISLKVEDKSSIDGVVISLTKPITGAEERCECSYNSGTDRYEYVKVIEPNTESGIWKIGSIYVADQFGNSNSIFGDKAEFSAADFVVMGTEGDHEAPIVDLNTLTVSTKEAAVGTEVVISFKVEDKSSIEAVVMHLTKPITGAEERCECSYNSETDRYEYVKIINHNTQNGIWKINYIYVSDEWHNGDILDKRKFDFSAADFAVSGAEGDKEAPVVDFSTLTVSMKEAVAKDKVVISFKVEDKSQIKEVSVNLLSPISGRTERGQCVYNGETGNYEYTRTIDKNMEGGIWKISDIYVNDQFGNEEYIYAYDVDMSAADFTVIETPPDVEAPIVDLSTLTAAPKAAMPGDKVTVSFKVEDESDIKSVKIMLIRPISGALESHNCIYNSETGYYEYTKIVDENTQSGKWKISWISVEDQYGNRQVYYDSQADLTEADFEITGTHVDAEAPALDLNTLTVSKKEAVNGDVLTISFKAEDESKITSVFLSLRNPKGAYTGGNECTYNSETGYYEYEKRINQNTEQGVWSIYAITLTDEFENSDTLSGRSIDMSAADFIVYENKDFIEIPPLSNVTSFSAETGVVDRTIEGDVYIGPDAVVTMRNVTVTGNIYVLGVLNASSISAKEIYARQILFWGFSNDMGTVKLSGDISVNELNSSDYVISEIPYMLQETPIQCIDGKLQVKGATLDFAEITVDGNPVKAPVNSKFMYEQEFQNGDEVTLAIKIPYYNIIRTEKIPVVQMTTTTDGGVQYKPVIETDEITLEQNQEYDLTQLIKATDKEDGDVSASLQVIDSDLDITTGGTYFVTVSVADSNGAITEKRIVVNVSAPLKSISLDKTQVTIQKGGEEQLTVSYSPENTTDDRTVSWSSSDETIVTVNEKGKLIAIGGGKAEVTATVGDKKAVCEVVVEVPLESIALNKEIMSLAIGGSEKLTVSYSPADATVGEKVVWRSDNEAAVTVDENGVVKAVATGTAKITASIGSIEASCSVTAGVLLESLEMSQAELTLEESEIQSLSVKCYPENTTVDQTAVIWKSSDESIATVGENGKVNGVGVGTATITALLAGQQAICNVTVTEGHKWIYTIPETEFAKVQVGDLFSIGFAQSIKMQVVEGHMSAKPEEEIWSGNQLCRFTQAGMVTLRAEWQAHDSEKRYQKLFKFIVSEREGDVKTTYLIKNTFKIGEPLSDEPAIVKKVVRFENCLYGSELSGLYGISQKTLEDLGNWFIIPDWGGAFSEYQNRTSFGLMPGYAAYQPGIFEIAAVSGEQVIGAPHNVEIEEAEVEVSVPKQVVAGDRIQISSRLGNTACKNLPVADIKTDLFIQEPGLEYDLGFQPTLEILEGEQLIQRENGDYSHTLESSEELTFTGSGKVRLKLSYKMINPYENGDGREFHPYNPEKIIEINVIEPVPIESVQLSAEVMELDLNEKTQLSAQVLPENTTESKDITWSSSNENVLIVDENGNVQAVGLGEAVVSASAGGKTGNCKVTVKLKPVSKGDINLDGEIDASDLMYMLQVVSERIGKEELTGSQVLAGDVEGNDGEITVDDLMKLLQYVSERITSLE